jgi:adenosylhomocysteine nucleosidase
MMRILVTFAVKAEFSQWCSRHPFVPYEFENWEKRRDFDLFKANFGSNEVTVLLTGMGRENAEEAMRTLPIEMHDLCISAGLAGALEGSLKPRDVVVARTSKTLDKKLRIESDAILVDFAMACGARAVNILLTSEKIVATADEKQDLSASGSIVEMETSYILTAAENYHVPIVAIRAISDAAEEDLPVDFGRILDSHGNLKYGGLFKEVGLHPYRLAPLIKFAGQSRAAAGALADFLDRFVSAIAAKWSGVPSRNVEEVSAT